ncbi:hypothetical protein [Pseudoalteromonas luteoviolacea]|uniref:Uncharacterized protein n=1 Tax=Pseudoalteromonas luteoviolacea S4060-1 TaxID=1365257 RepID=A0A161Z1T7_9GAMM|nr:hypothetical protein [Pseudoalteromonas luteoviolacea]KZN70389.1 hypothetical protein N478_00365 [Pseudoalteromonas luteoviolacea S4060-1]
MSLVEQLKSVDRGKFKGVEHYKPSDVAPVLIALVDLDDESCNENIYNQALFAIGNNHGGTYYLAFQEALNFILISAVEGSSEVSRSCALEMLTDIHCAFVPELTQEIFHLYDKLQSDVKKEVKEFYPKLLELADLKDESQRNRKLACDLIEFIRDPEC